MKKQCRMCGKIKLLSEFRKNKSSSVGHRIECKMCEKIQTKMYRYKNRKKIKDKKKKKYLEHKDRMCDENDKDYRDKFLVKRRGYYKKNKDRICVKNRKRTRINRRRLNKIKLERGCLVCKEKKPFMHFHHRKGSQENKCLGSMCGATYSWKNIETEMKKCEVLCNWPCHSIYHSIIGNKNYNNTAEEIIEIVNRAREENLKKAIA